MSLPDFSKVRVLVIGDVMLDRYVVGDVDRISPEAPVPVFTKVPELGGNLDRPGGAANVAANVWGLGAKVTLVGLAGLDQDGYHLSHLLADLCPGLDDRIEAVSGGTTVKTRFVTRSGQHVLRMDVERAVPDESLIDKLVDDLDLGLYDVIIVSDYGKGVVSEGLMQRLTEDSRVIVDPKQRDPSFYDGCAFITPNMRELEQMTGTASIPDSIAKLSSALDDAGVLATLGAQGMALLYPPEELRWIGTEAREVFDVSGAGDTVIAVFATALAADMEPIDAAYLANAAAGVVVAKRGTHAIKLNELRAALPRKPVVGFANGVFDLLHAGHIEMLRAARAMCDRLIVGVNDDASTRRLKGNGRPVVPELQRIKALLALPFVDRVELFGTDTPLSLICELKPDIIFKGGDYKEHQVMGFEEVKTWGGRVEIIPYVEGFSTTKTIERIKGQ